MKHILFTALLLAASSATAQKLAPSLQTYMAENTARGSRAAVSDTLNAYLTVTSAEEACADLEKLGIRAKAHTDKLLTAQISSADVEGISQISSVRYVQLATEVHEQMDKARAASNADIAHRDDNSLAQAYKGKGVIVGVVDAGFEYGHVDFLAPDGRFRILRVWDQTSTSMFGETPEGYSYGKEFTTESEIRQARYDRTETYHGSHVTGIAAGGDMTTPYYGVAPEADLVFVAYKSTTSNIIDGVRYISDYAKSLGRPCVINISLGSHIGPHDGTSVNDQALSAAAQNGCIIVGACGNEGDVALHARKVLESETDQLKTSVQFSSSSSTKRAYVDIWATKGKNIRVRGVVFDARKGSIIASTDEVSTETPTEEAQQTQFQTSACGMEGYIQLSSAIDPNNGRPNVVMRTSVTNLSANRIVGLIVTGDAGTEVNMWNTQYQPFKGSLPGWTNGDTDYTVDEIGGTSNDVISVGCYQTRDTYTDVSGNVYPDASQRYDIAMGDITPFSSKGPTLDGRMKPDVVAPGWIVISAQSKYYSGFASAYAVASTTKDGDTYYYDGNGGTSMASPYVAGSVALWLEACPTLTTADVRDIIKQTAVAYPESSNYDKNKQGYGKIDTYAGLAVAHQKVSGIARIPGSDLEARVQADASTGKVQLTFRQDQGAARVALFNANGMCVAQANAATTAPGETLNLPTSNLVPGVYIVRVASEASAPQTLKVVVK